MISYENVQKARLWLIGKLKDFSLFGSLVFTLFLNATHGRDDFFFSLLHIPGKEKDLAIKDSWVSLEIYAVSKSKCLVMTSACLVLSGLVTVIKVYTLTLSKEREKLIFSRFISTDLFTE